jgi:hypothetical protein
MRKTPSKSSTKAQEWMFRRGIPVGKMTTWEELSSKIPEEYSFSFYTGKTETKITIYKETTVTKRNPSTAGKAHQTTTVKESFDLIFPNAIVYDGVEWDLQGLYKAVVEWVMKDYKVKRRRSTK